jgi:hypothetical protein
MNQQCRPTSLLSFLEAENIRLRQAVVELWLDTTALREAVKRRESGERFATDRPRDRRPAPRVMLIHDVDDLSSK